MPFPRSPSRPLAAGEEAARNETQAEGAAPAPQWQLPTRSAKAARRRWGRRPEQPASAQTRQQTRKRAGVRQGLKADLQGSRGSEVKRPLSTTGIREQQGHATDESLLQTGKVWLMWA